MMYKIDYEYGRAILYTPSKEWEERFIKLASQCFGIRKSIGEVKLMSEREEEPTDKLENEYERLEHNGDVIVWNQEGEKIETEFDE